MRRSSSTTSRCGALSDSATAGPAMSPPVALARPACAIGPRNETQHAVAACIVDHRGEERPRRLVRVRPKPRESAGDALGLQAGQLHGKLFALWRDEQQAMPPVVRSLL